MKAPRTTRPRDVIARELDGLEKLVSTTAKTAKDRAPLVLRTANAYAEWVAAAERDCGADHDAPATSGDVGLSHIAVKRAKELCRELEKSGAKQRCR